jgi:toxin-antitoxin system PIN domain toxin
MIVVDINVLIYAYNAGAPEHPKARAWIENAFSASDPLFVPWAVVHAFLRLTTKARLLMRPFTIEEAVAIVEEWFSSGAVLLIEPGPRYWSVLRELVTRSNIVGDLVADAHIAALALERNATVCTADRDFQRFPGVRVINPLA